MTGLLLVLTAAGGERFEAAVELAATAAALGRPVAVLLKGEALTADLGLLLDLGAELVACQTSMASHGVAAGALAEGVVAGGMVSVLAGREAWQLLLA